MTQKVIGVLLVLTVTLAACGGGETDTAASLPMEIQLIAGTLLLEETSHPVTAEQAQELLPAWQMFRALRQEGSTTSQTEIDTVLGQVQAAMTAEQQTAIEEMHLTSDDVRATAQKMGVNPSGPPAGMTPADMIKLSDEERSELMAQRAGGGLIDKLIEWLEARAGEE